MKWITSAACAAIVLVTAVPATATTLTFVGGTALASSTVQTTPGNYIDLFSFSASDGDLFSGSLTTHELLADPSDPASDVLSNLDFTAASLNNMTTGLITNFTVPGAATSETVSLPSTVLTAGDYALTVSYTVTAASADSAASFSGPINLAAGEPGTVPEPASWALFICGFGAIGVGLRVHRRPRVDFTA